MLQGVEFEETAKNIQGVSGGMIKILGGGSMGYCE
jgi:hypothetical protein